MKARAAILRPGSSAGFTLTELLVATAISAVVLSQLVLASYALQRSFGAANYRMSAQEDQLRLLDYISRDLYMASAVVVQNDSAQITATLPPAGTALLNLHFGLLLTPVTPAASAPATGSPTTVIYFAEGGQCVRQVGSVQTVIADTVASLTFTRDGSFLVVDATFTPEFSNSPTTATQPATRASRRIYLGNAGSAN